MDKDEITKKIKEMEVLDFDEVKHQYILDGEILPSVTQLMGPLSDAYYGGVDEFALSNAADRGTAVHNAIENWLDFGIVDIPEEFKGYMDGFMGWFNAYHPEVLGGEIRLYHELLRYAGTCDLLCYINGKLTLVDYKTSAAVSEMMYGVQLEAYAQALSNHGITVQDKIILHLTKDGNYKEYHFKAKDAPRWRVFGALKTICDYINTK